MRHMCATILGVSVLFAYGRPTFAAPTSGKQPAASHPQTVTKRDGKAGSALKQKVEVKGGRSGGVRVFAGLGHTRGIAELVAGASSIVRGTVASVEDVGDAVVVSGRSEIAVGVLRAHFKIASVVKGPARESGASLHVEFYLPFVIGPPWRELRPGEHGLLFLSADGTPFDRYYPLLPVPPNAPAPPKDLPPLDAVKQYLLLSLQPDTPEPTLRSAVEGVLDLKMQGTAEPLLQVATSSDPQIAGDALWGLVKLQDARAIPAAVDFVLASPASAQRQVWRVSDAIGGLTDPGLADDVEPLLSAPSATWRREALSALRNMRNPQSMPLLAKALSDADLENRYIAMMALAETTGKYGPRRAERGPFRVPSADTTGKYKGWAPSRANFDENPEYYLSHWREWWQREGAAEYGSRAPSGE